jgi:hypothetical protein
VRWERFRRGLPPKSPGCSSCVPQGREVTLFDMERRFYASHQVAGPKRVNRNLWFESESEAERVCDELGTPPAARRSWTPNPASFGFVEGTARGRPGECAILGRC